VRHRRFDPALGIDLIKQQLEGIIGGDGDFHRPVEVFHIRDQAARGLQQCGQSRSSLSAPSVPRADFFASRARHPADSNSHRADSDAKIGRRPDRTGDNPDDASADIKLNQQA
jgi:hypothetical protein